MGQVCRKPEKKVDDNKKRKKKRKHDIDNDDDDDDDDQEDIQRTSSKRKSSSAHNKTSAEDDEQKKREASDLKALIESRNDPGRLASLTDEEKQALLKSVTAGGGISDGLTEQTNTFSESQQQERREAKRQAREQATLSAKLDEIRQVYEQDRSDIRRARAQLAEIERARQLIDDDTARYENFIQDIFHLTSRSAAHSLALRAETMYEKLHTVELERLEEANVNLLAETVVYYDVLPRVYCDARREILRENQARIGNRKQQLFWHQSKLLHYEGLVEQQTRRIDNVIVMARYLQDQASDQGYLLWAERFRKLRGIAQYIDSLRFETNDLRSELSYLIDFNRVQLEDFGAKRLNSLLMNSTDKLARLRDALRRNRQRRVGKSVMRTACQALATTVYAPRELPPNQLEFLDSQIRVCVQLAKLFALISGNHRLRLKTRNAQMLAKIVSLCKKHNTPASVWRETTARVRSHLGDDALDFVLRPAWATVNVYESQVRQAAAVAAAANNTAKANNEPLIPQTTPLQPSMMAVENLALLRAQAAGGGDF